MEVFVRQFQVFLLVWVRLLGIFSFAPVLSSMDIPARVRFLLAFLLALLVYPLASVHLTALPKSMRLYGLVAVNQVLVGIIIGFFLLVIFSSLRLSAQYFSMQIGLGMSQVFDPVTQEQAPLLGYLFNMVAILTFLVIGGMHMVVHGAVDSFRLVPLIDMTQAGPFLMTQAVRYVSFLFAIALKLAFPIVASSVVILFCIGLIGKAAPQSNIMILGLPIQFGMGSVLLLATIPFFIELFANLFSGGFNDVMHMLQRLGNQLSYRAMLLESAV